MLLNIGSKSPPHPNSGSICLWVNAALIRCNRWLWLVRTTATLGFVPGLQHPTLRVFFSDFLGLYILNVSEIYCHDWQAVCNVTTSTRSLLCCAWTTKMKLRLWALSPVGDGHSDKTLCRSWPPRSQLHRWEFPYFPQETPGNLLTSSINHAIKNLIKDRTIWRALSNSVPFSVSFVTDSDHHGSKGFHLDFLFGRTHP